MPHSAPASPPQAVPYQAYKPKRHSRNLSNASPRLSPSPVSSPPVSPPNSRPVLAPAVLEVPSSNSLSNGLPSPPASADSHESLDSPVTPQFALQVPSLPSPTLSVPTVKLAPTVPATPPAPSPPQTLTTSQVPQPPPPATRKTSTFRRVPLRNSRPSLPASPLGPNAPTRSHSHAVSVSSLPSTQSNGLSTSPAASPLPTERQLPPLPAPEVDQPRPRAVSSSHSTAPSPDLSSPPISKTTSYKSSSRIAADHSRQHSALSSPSRSSTPSQNRISAPYRPGFQPKGVYRPLTDEFMAIRKAKRDGDSESGGMKRVERTKLERRLEKLIALHFPSPVDEKSSDTLGVGKRRPGISATVGQENRRASSFFDLDNLRSMSINDAGDLWRGVLSGGLVDTTKMDIRAAEQRITPWQDDASVSKCPLCVFVHNYTHYLLTNLWTFSTSFHPLTNRKHHCRLCGQIICSLPIKRPQRPVTCSLLFVMDPKTRCIEEVGEGVDYGVKKRKTPLTTDLPKQDSEEEKFLKGVRICRECRPILLRQQYQRENQAIPPFVRLYEVFVDLEKDIEESLPQFQELILSLNHNDQPTKEASAARKRLLEAFAQYDALSKRIRKLPCPNGPGSSQDRVQMAILTRANIFLQKNMFPLQSLPTPKRAETNPSVDLSIPNTPQIDPDSELAHHLQPLLEQEALLETFVEEAKSQRKFEDVKTLKTNLAEIRREIEKLMDNAETSQAQRVSNKSGTGNR
ncbi:hypothetical protein BDQ12DRAFT_598244 [Crucibulum laeve]|uniref:FYVE zinc finger domain-containing protein n=1 Tax=Crucibulum laeve TaxID=68775 RepID=A0A5C3MBK3_9AGAR|nr:hypothetical protein BDQ12DRAFT_598244 [Crucibulum laeve]